MKWENARCNTGTEISHSPISNEADAYTECSNDPNCKAAYSADCSTNFKLCSGTTNLRSGTVANNCVFEKIEISSNIH